MDRLIEGIQSLLKPKSSERKIERTEILANAVMGLKGLILEKTGVDGVIVFGSSVRGKPDPKDIDFMVITDLINPNWILRPDNWASRLTMPLEYNGYLRSDLSDANLFDHLGEGASPRANIFLDNLKSGVEKSLIIIKSSELVAKYKKTFPTSEILVVSKDLN